MTAGRGWIAIALVIFATWNPVRAALGAYLFGGVEALQFRSAEAGTKISPFFLNMLPYLFTIVVLVLATGDGAPPGGRARGAIPVLGKSELRRGEAYLTPTPVSAAAAAFVSRPYFRTSEIGDWC